MVLRGRNGRNFGWNSEISEDFNYLFLVLREISLSPKHSHSFGDLLLIKIQNTLGLSDTMINELIERQNNGTNRIGILNDIFEIGYGHKFLYCLFEFFAGDYTPYADSNGEFILVNKDDNKQEFYRVVTAETLNEILKYRFIKVLDEIKKEFERKKYTHYDFNIQPKDILSALKQTLEDSNIETLDDLNF